MENLGVIINSKARNSDSFEMYADALSKKNIHYTLYQTDPENLDNTIKECIPKHPVILAGGGDGTIRCAAQHCANTSVILGVLPLGTMNHFAKETDLPANPEELIEAIINKKTITVDTAEVNGLIFINNSSIGFYPDFAKKRVYYNRFYNKWLSYLPGFIQALKRHETFSLQIKNKEMNRTLRTSFLMVTNNLYSYKFPLAIERENFNKAELGVYFFKHGKLQLSKIINYFFKRKNSFEMKKSTLPIEIHIADRDSITVSVDGETMVTKTPLHYKSLPGSLILLANKT